MPSTPHVLIVGAGMTGLLLAQNLKSHNISFSIYERDPNAEFRGAGWGLAIHWAVDTFLSLLPEHLREQIPEATVDPEALARGERGRFPFFDLVTGERRFENVSEKRIRVSRKRVRGLMLGGLDVEWNKTVHEISQDPDTKTVTLTFTDGSQAHGTHLVGCDGSRSQVRKQLCLKPGTSPLNHRLDIRLLGASVIYPSAMGRRMQEQDTYFFQGGDQAASSFMFFAVQDTPFHNDRVDQDTYACQLIVSWPYRAGFLGREQPIEVPDSQEGRLGLMKEIAASWAAPFRDAVFAVPEDTHIQHVHLESWVPELGAWDNLDGRATLIGDSAHTMTMFRGEAFNHGIVDVEKYVSSHLPVLTGEKDISGSGDACAAYESEMVERTRLAVGASSEACLDAHSVNHERITEGSPLVSKRMGRAVVATSA